MKNMPRINQEEYEILKGLDDKWKWIARDGEFGPLNIFSVKPIKVQSQWNYMDLGYKHAELTKKESKMLQFIQWEDEEPYSIAELIEEYEFENVLSDEERFYELYNVNESEETEVKNIGWLKRAIKEYAYANYGNRMKIDIGEEELDSLIDQLDEPEKTVLPKFVANWIESYRKKTLVELINDAVYSSDEDSQRFRRWFHEEMGFESNYSEFLSRVWLDGFKVEEEQKYVLSINITDKASKTNYETFLNKRGIFHSMENDSFNSEEFNWTEEEIKGLESGKILFEHFAVKVEEREAE